MAEPNRATHTPLAHLSNTFPTRSLGTHPSNALPARSPDTLPSHTALAHSPQKCSPDTPLAHPPQTFLSHAPLTHFPVPTPVRRRGAQGQGGAQRATLADVKEQAPSTADQKPTYSSGVAFFVNVIHLYFHWSLRFLI